MPAASVGLLCCDGRSLRRSDGNALRSVLKFAIAAVDDGVTDAFNVAVPSAPGCNAGPSLPILSCRDVRNRPRRRPLAQIFTYNALPKPVTVPQRPGEDGQMLVQANQVDYDYQQSPCGCSGGRQRAAVLQWNQRRGGQGHLRSEDQAVACRRQHPHDRCRRQDHLRRYPGFERRLPRRLRRSAARPIPPMLPAWR